jgi:hypothetical protein
MHSLRLQRKRVKYEGFERVPSRSGGGITVISLESTIGFRRFGAALLPVRLSERERDREGGRSGEVAAFDLAENAFRPLEFMRVG